jgi:predicted Zn-dependent protease
MKDLFKIFYIKFMIKNNTEASYISRNSGHGVRLLSLLLLTVLILPIALVTSELNYPRVLDQPWDHSPITVYIDNKNVTPHYSPTYYTQVQKALNYWERGGNGKLKYTPVFKLVASEKADIRIRWVENLQEVSGDTIPLILNGQFLRVDITLGVGNYQWIAWNSYSDAAMLALAEHELGHALGLEHSNDRRDIMYPTLLNEFNSFLLSIAYIAMAIVVFLSVSWLLSRKK